MCRFVIPGGACAGGEGGRLTTTPQTPKKTKVKDVRLPTSVEPLYYDLELQPFMYSGNPDEFSFRGYVSVAILCHQPTDNVTLHANKLNILEGSVTFSATSSPAVTSSSPAMTSWEEDKERQFLVVHLDREMKVGERYTLTLNFTGPLKDDLHGLYLSSYERGNKTM